MEEQTEVLGVISWFYGSLSTRTKAQTLSNDWNPHYLHQSGIFLANHEDSVKQQTEAR